MSNPRPIWHSPIMSHYVCPVFLQNSMAHLTQIWVLFQAHTIITFQGCLGRFFVGKTATVEATSPLPLSRSILQNPGTTSVLAVFHSLVALLLYDLSKKTEQILKMTTILKQNCSGWKKLFKCENNCRFVNLLRFDNISFLLSLG